MKKDKILQMGDRGYILLVVVVMMLAMAVMAFGMNRRAGMQARMSANQIRSSQVHLGQIADLPLTRSRVKQTRRLISSRLLASCRFPTYH